jgi:hypothetical protein
VTNLSKMAASSPLQCPTPPTRLSPGIPCVLFDVSAIDPSTSDAVSSDSFKNNHSHNSTDCSDADNHDNSCTTVTQVITNVDDLPEDKFAAIGTVLMEEKDRSVPLLIEFLGDAIGVCQATRSFLNDLRGSHLELCIECQFLPTAFYFSSSESYAEVYLRDPLSAVSNLHYHASASRTPEWKLCGKTESISNAYSPRYVTKFVLPVMFDDDMKKCLLVRLWSRSIFGKFAQLGEASCTIWDVVSAKGQCKVLNLVRSIKPNKNSWIILTGDVSRNRNRAATVRSVTLNVAFEARMKPRSKTHFVVNRSLKKGRWTPVYRSEGCLRGNWDFSTALLTYDDMFAGDERKPSRIEFFQQRTARDPKLSGFVQFSVLQLKTMTIGCTFQWWSATDSVPLGHVVLSNCVITPFDIGIWLTMIPKVE